MKQSSFQLPTGAKVEIVVIRLANGKIITRTPDELVARPTPPAPAKQGS